MKTQKPFSLFAVKNRIKGFTLIEIMIVVLIIVTLIAIMIPVVGTMREKARATATRERMATIGTGLETYKNDFGGYYPPSTPGQFKGVAGANNNKNLYISSGSAMLAEALIGYLGYEFDGAGTLAPTGLDPNDFGFRKSGSGRGRVYGPYTDQNALSKLSSTGSATIRIESVPAYSFVTQPATGVSRMVYLDGYGNEILYYRATDVINVSNVFGTSANAVFVNTDNAQLGVVASAPAYDPAANGTAKFFDSMQAGSANSGSGSTPSNCLGRTSYVLISSHKNGTFFDDDDVVGPLR